MSFVFDFLHFWHDGSARTGPENMAVDEWLLETCTQPVLRVYPWQDGWGSVGYFGRLEEARTNFPPLSWVRRWTGGGTVDHSDDWTYTLVAPAGGRLSATRGAESYRIIHAALGEVLRKEGLRVRLSGGDQENGASSCFENPVCHDLVDSSGRKIAGAGQRRSRHGLLHQGSVSGKLDGEASLQRGSALAHALSAEICHIPGVPDETEVIRRSIRYMDTKWTTRR